MEGVVAVSDAFNSDPERQGLHYHVDVWSKIAPSDVRPRSEVWLGFEAEPHADAFTQWLVALHRSFCGQARVRAPDLCQLLARMETLPPFRARCFELAVDALGHCDDRIALGFNQMQAESLISQGEDRLLSSEALFDALLRLFNHQALQTFAAIHAHQVGKSEENVEVVLALETRLRERLDLPGGVAAMNFGKTATEDCQVTLPPEDTALAHVHKLQKDPGSDGLWAFLGGQISEKPSVWVAHLQRHHAGAFDDLYEEAMALLDAESAQVRGDGHSPPDSGQPYAQEQAGVESKALYWQLHAALVRQLTEPLLGGKSIEISNVPETRSQLVTVV